MSFRTGTYICGVRARQWNCPRCGVRKHRSGHRCQHCKRRVCCDCFDHLDAMCVASDGALRPCSAATVTIDIGDAHTDQPDDREPAERVGG